jgi:hypothetical protein
MEGENMTLYQGIFNWKGEHYDDWVRAHSKDQAFRLLTARLSTALNTTAFTVRQYFTQKAHSYEIKEIKE